MTELELLEAIHETLVVLRNYIGPAIVFGVGFNGGAWLLFFFLYCKDVGKHF
jgi:hypothetical protein